MQNPIKESSPVESDSLNEVLVVGFGAVGAIYSYILKNSGLARVSSVARGNYGVIAQNGLTIRSGKYGNIDSWKPDSLYPSVADSLHDPKTGRLIPYTHVFITTKSIPELTPTSEILAPLLTVDYARERVRLNVPAQPVYVVMQNGMGVERGLFDAVRGVLKDVDAGDEEPRVVGTAVWIGTNMNGPNTVEHNNFDRVTLGVYRPERLPPTPTPSPILTTLDNLLSIGGTEVTLVPEIQRIKYAKNLWNLGFAAFCTLTGWTIPALCRDRPTGDQSSHVEPWLHESTRASVEAYVWPNIQKLLEEAITVGQACGFDDPIEGSSGLPYALAKSTMENTRALHVRADSVHVPSMLLDQRLGRPIEVEGICGEVVRMGRDAGVDVPRIELLYSLLLVVQNQIIREAEKKRGGEALQR